VGEWNHFPHLIDKLKTISSQSNIIETLQIAVSYLSLPSRRDASQWEEPISLVQQRLGCLKKFEVRLSRYSGESSEMHEFMEELRIYLRPFDRTGILDLKLGYLVSIAMFFRYCLGLIHTSRVSDTGPHNVVVCCKTASTSV